MRTWRGRALTHHFDRVVQGRTVQVGTHAGRIDLHGFVDDVPGSLRHHQHREGRDKLAHRAALQSQF